MDSQAYRETESDMGREQDRNRDTERPRAGNRSLKGMTWKRAHRHRSGGAPVQAQLNGSPAPGEVGRLLLKKEKQPFPGCPGCQLLKSLLGTPPFQGKNMHRARAQGSLGGDSRDHHLEFKWVLGLGLGRA